MIKPYLLSVATAVPQHRLGQKAVLDHARQVFAGRAPEFERLEPVFGNSGVETRYFSAPLDWFREPRGWAEANRVYLETAERLLEEAAETALRRSGLDAAAVDTLITVSSTGIATPGLDARLMARMGFRDDVKRIPVFGLGCAGGVLGLGRAAQMAAARAGETVLLVVVELCSLTFRWRDTCKSNQVATALFGDGAAAAVIRGLPDGEADGAAALSAWGEYTWPDTLGLMGWSIEEDGFGLVFSSRIPALARSHMHEVTGNFLGRHGLTLADIDRFACHPGGSKVAAAIETAYGLAEGGLETSRGVLRDYGNMSSATVLFVLDRMMEAGTGSRRGPEQEGERILVQALGPGFTAGFAVLEAA